jgi:hypothetical protein
MARNPVTIPVMNTGTADPQLDNDVPKFVTSSQVNSSSNPYGR